MMEHIYISLFTIRRRKEEIFYLYKNTQFTTKTVLFANIKAAVVVMLNQRSKMIPHVIV